MWKMDFKVINQDLETKFLEIRQRILRLQSGGTIDSLENVGADTNRQIGASYVSLKQLASRYEPDEALALLLWNTRFREEQIMACLLLPGNINKEKITQLTDHCLNFEIAGYMGSLFLYRYPELSEIAQEWDGSEVPFRETALLTALARHLIVFKEQSQISKEFFKTVLQRNHTHKYVKMIAERYRYNI